MNGFQSHVCFGTKAKLHVYVRRSIDCKCLNGLNKSFTPHPWLMCRSSRGTQRKAMSANLRAPWEHQSNTLHNWSVKLVLFVLTHIWNFSSSISRNRRDLWMTTPHGNKNPTIISIDSVADNTTHRPLLNANENKRLIIYMWSGTGVSDWCQGLVQSVCLTMLLIALIRLCWLRFRSQQSNYPVLFSYKNKMELRFSMRTRERQAKKKQRKRKQISFLCDFLSCLLNSLFVPNGRFSLIFKALGTKQEFRILMLFFFCSGCSQLKRIPNGMCSSSGK